MRLLVLDFETLYGTVDETQREPNYTLSSMSTEAYVRDLRFRPHLCGFRWQDGESYWVPAIELPEHFASIDWSDVGIIAHHAQFDGLILSHHYGVKPAFWFDTLSYARLLHGNHLSVALDALARLYDMRGKTINYVSFKGKTWEQLSAREQTDLGEGCLHDCEITWQIFHKLAPQMPQEELRLVDTTVRWFTEPALRADVDLLGKVWETANKSKIDRMAALGITPEELQSSDRFADLLRNQGVEPEMKTSPKGNQIFAFAKTDQFMRDLLEDDNDTVRALAEARLGAKSSLLQTRAETLGFMATRRSGRSDGFLPVYLRYAGASTLRFSGGDQANWQNFKRGSDIRRAILAPEGYLLAPIDLAQVECRMLNWLAGQEDVVEKFRNDQDPYVGIASEFYGRPITKADPDERGTGKQAELSCGYGCGAKKFKATARLGIYGPPVHLTDEESVRFVGLYRDTHEAVIAYWQEAGNMLKHLAGGSTIQWGPLWIKDHRIYVPNGAMMNYETLHWHVPSTEEIDEAVKTGDDRRKRPGWRRRTRNGWDFLWGAKLAQHVCEALSRLAMTQALLRMQDLGYRSATTTHDEALMLIPKDGREEYHLERCIAEMTRTPEWAPGLPLGAEGSLAERYSK